MEVGEGNRAMFALNVGDSREGVIPGKLAHLGRAKNVSNSTNPLWFRPPLGLCHERSVPAKITLFGLKG